MNTCDKATPRSSLESERSPDFGEEYGQSKEKSSHSTTQQSPRLDHATFLESEPPQSSAPQTSNSPKSPDILCSNNPFRRAISNNGFPLSQRQPLDGDLKSISNRHEVSPHGETVKYIFSGRDTLTDVSSAEMPIAVTANLSLADRPFSEHPNSHHHPALDLNEAFRKQENEPNQRKKPSSSKSPRTSAPLPPIPSSSDKTTDDCQSCLTPFSGESLVGASFLQMQSGLSNGESGASQGNSPTEGSMRPGMSADLRKELPAMPETDTSPSKILHASARPAPVVHDQDATPSQGTITEDGHLQEHLPPKPPGHKASLDTVVEAEIAKLWEQRNETYSIKHFNWFCSKSRSLRRSSMLTQNKNGPCPLLALVNALILGAENDSQSALGTALRTREQVSLGLIIESLMDELTSEGRGGALTELPDVDELNRFLLKLHTGMTANPKLAALATPSPNLMDARNSSSHLPISLNCDRSPGTFEDTQDMRLYGAFAVPLIHGWLAPRSHQARNAFSRSAQTYEDAQTIQFREEELEDKLSSVGLTAEEQQLLQDISSIKSFLQSHPSQITQYGLDIINESLFPGAFAILFRNDHFSTIYKQPESGQLFTLVTDAGYCDKDEVIWESLVDVSGQKSEFFSGDFRPVGNVDTSSDSQQVQQNRTTTPCGPKHSTLSLGITSPTSPQEQQQADADFAMALQLQEEEEARIEDSRHRSNVIEPAPDRPSAMNNNRSREQEGSRPAIPPRHTRTQGVNRSVDPNSDEAPPPAYEEAAKGKPYLPPLGHPQHPSFDGRSPISSPSTPMHPPGPRAGPSAPSRMSAFQESSQFQNIPPLSRQPTNNSVGVGQHSGRSRDRDKDCIVM